MALDTKEKRAAVLGVGRPWMRDKFPVATPDQEWRVSSGNAYGGNAIAAPTIPTALTIKHEGLLRNVGRFMGSVLLLVIAG